MRECSSRRREADTSVAYAASRNRSNRTARRSGSGRQSFFAGASIVVPCNIRDLTPPVARGRFDVVERRSGAIGKLNWWTGLARIRAREVPVAGWNYPLNRATGLDGDGQRDFGRRLGAELRLT